MNCPVSLFHRQKRDRCHGIQFKTHYILFGDIYHCKTALRIRDEKKLYASILISYLSWLLSKVISQDWTKPLLYYIWTVGKPYIPNEQVLIGLFP